MTRSEKKMMIGGIVIAILIGSLAACAAYSIRREDQFHGGVLDADINAALWAAVSDGVIAFAEFAIPTLVIFGVLPILVRRLFIRQKTGGSKSDD